MPRGPPRSSRFSAGVKPSEIKMAMQDFQGLWGDAKKVKNQVKRNLFESCMSPMQGCHVTSTANVVFEEEERPIVQQNSSSAKSSRRDQRKKKLKKMEGRVKKQVAAAYVRRCESMLTTKDDKGGSNTQLLTEFEMQKQQPALNGGSSTDDTDYTNSTSSSFADDTTLDGNHNSELNTIGEDTYNRANGGAPASPSSSTGGVRVVKPSFRSKFNYYRSNKLYGSKEPPSDTSMKTFKSMRAEEAVKFGTFHNMMQRRNELAKQILQRRQAQAGLQSRTGVDP